MSFKNDGIMKNWCFVADDQAVSLRPAAGVQVDRNNLPAGTVALVDRQNKVLASLPATGEVRFLYGLGANKNPIQTPLMDVTRMTLTKKKYVQPTEQVTYIGYNGTTGSVPNVNSQSFHIMLHMTQNDSKHRGSNQFYEVLAQYTTSAASSQLEWAKNMQKEFAANLAQFEREVTGASSGYAKVELTSDGTLADFTGTATMIKLTKGSVTAEFVDAAGAASTGTAAVGDVFAIPTSSGTKFTYTASANAVVIYIGTTALTVADAGTAAQNATAQAAAINASGLAGAEVSTADVIIHTKPNSPIPVPVVYDSTATAFIDVVVNTGDAVPTRLIAATAATAAASFTFETPYQGETGYFVGGTSTDSNTGVVGTITNYGLKVTGVKEEYSPIIWKDYVKNSFTLTVRKGSLDAGVTITYTTKASDGYGAYETVAGWEYQSMLDAGEGTLATYIPNEAPTLFSGANNEYSIVNIAYYYPIDSMIGYGGKTYWNIKFALELDSAGNLIAGSQGDQLAETLLGAAFNTADLDA